MNPMPQHQPRIQPAIQAGADALLAMIEVERMNAAAASHERFQRLEQLFHTYRQHAEGVHAADQAKLGLLCQQLLQAQARFAHLQQESAQVAQLRGTEASATVALRDDWENMRAEIIRVTMELLEAQRVGATATAQFEALQSALEKVGITFDSADNSLQFSAGWTSVLAEVETKGQGPMNPERLYDLLRRLTQKLQSDRDQIAALEAKILSSEQEQQKVVENYEMEITSLKLEVSMLQDAARSQSSRMPSESPQQQPEDKQSGTGPHDSATLITAKVTHPTPQTLAAWNKSGSPFYFPHVLSELQHLKGRPMAQITPGHGTIAHTPMQGESAEMDRALHERPMPHIPRIDLRSVQSDSRRKMHKSTAHV